MCIRSLGNGRSNPDTDFPDNSTFGTYSSAGPGVPYIASEIGLNSNALPMDFTVGDRSAMNNFPNRYDNGPINGDETLDCFIRYFVSTSNVSWEVHTYPPVH